MVMKLQTILTLISVFSFIQDVLANSTVQSLILTIPNLHVILSFTLNPILIDNVKQKATLTLSTTRVHINHCTTSAALT